MFINIHFPEIYNRLQNRHYSKDGEWLYGDTRHAKIADMVSRYCKQFALSCDIEEYKGVFYFEFPASNMEF